MRIPSFIRVAFRIIFFAVFLLVFQANSNAGTDVPIRILESDCKTAAFLDHAIIGDIVKNNCGLNDNLYLRADVPQLLRMLTNQDVALYFDHVQPVLGTRGLYATNRRLVPAYELRSNDGSSCVIDARNGNVVCKNEGVQP